MNPVSARLLNQQLICPQFSAPHEVVEWMGVLQAQDYKMMRWAVAMRTKLPSLKAFEQDFNAGRIVRTHLFRTTWQLVSGEDLGWMLELCRESALRGLRSWMNTNDVSIPEAEQHSVQQIFADVLAKNQVAYKSEFAAALAEKGIAMPDQRLSYHIRLAEYAGLVCSGDLTPLKKTYALVSAKLPATRPLPREEALALLARKYFRSHGPATLEDFAWWCGLGLNACRQGIAALGSELVRERWKGLDLYSHQDSRIRGFRSGCVHLLPPYDEYLIGYKSRHVSLHPDHSHRAHNNSGIFWPVLLQDGEVIGNWNTSTGKVATEIFHPAANLNDNALAKEINRFNKYLSR